jgi:beta-hydroxylase
MSSFKMFKLIIIFILLLIGFWIIQSELDRNRSVDSLSLADWYRQKYYLMSPYNNLIQYSIPIEQSTPILPLHMFPQHLLLENNWQVMRDEAVANLDKAHDAQDLSSQFFSRIATPKWKLFMLHWYGKEYTENLKQCPSTAQLLKLIPNMRVAMFSIMDGGNFVPAHRGPYRGALRYHLALETPRDQENCFIVIGGKKHVWKEGEGVLFDDTYEHYVMNNTTDRRIVLFLDIDRSLPKNTVAFHLTKWVSNSSLPLKLSKLNSKQETSISTESKEE